MKLKKILFLVTVLFMLFVLVGCKKDNEQPKPDNNDTPGEETVVTTTYTVIFNVDGERYATAKVKDGAKITQTIDAPTKEGHSFVGWYDGDTLVDLASFVVTKDTTLTAKFAKDDVDTSLDVNATKEAGKTYTLVIGWWEVNDPAQPDKKTSYLTEELVQKFYANVNLYLKVKGLTEDEIKNVQFRNYSTKSVADMGALVNADGDVDIMIGVGNNINSSAGVSLYEGSNDNKFATTMGTTPTSRYVALTSFATELGVNVYDWLTTEVGKTAFNVSLKESDIVIAPVRTNDANLDVIVYTDDTNFVTLHFETKDATVTLPEIEDQEGTYLAGFALTPDGEVVLNKAGGDVITYNNVKDLVGEDGKVTLYPIIKEVVVVEEDLIVYVQVGSNLSDEEVLLLADRFRASLPEYKNILFSLVEADAEGFTEQYNNAECCDVVIGGNNPLKNFTAHAEGPLANAGAKHFANTSRKVLISAGTTHLELAKALYDFVVTDAPSYEVHVSFWLNENKWITTDELATLKTGLENSLNTYFAVPEGSTLTDLYNITLTTYDCTSTKVADLAAETNALRDGLGTDLIVGCGANVTTTGGYTDASVLDIDKSVVAADRKVALVSENFLAALIFGFYFDVETEELDLVVIVYTDDTNFVTLLFSSSNSTVTIPEIVDPENSYLAGFALSPDGEVVLDKYSEDELTYNDVKDLIGEDGKVTLYPVFNEYHFSEEDLVVYIQTGSNLSDAEAILLARRFRASLSEYKDIMFCLVEADAAGFTEDFNNADKCDVVIGGNNPLKNFTAHSEGPLANAGAKHFANTSRKVLISANTTHLELAKALYDFVVTDAPSYEVHVSFWLNENKWITTDELATLKTGLENSLNTYFAVPEGSTLTDLYNITLTTYDCTSTKVADLAAETNALRDGLGTDLIVGCGANVTTTGGYTDAIVASIDTTLVAADRKVALISENFLADLLFDLYFDGYAD